MDSILSFFSFFVHRTERQLSPLVSKKGSRQNSQTFHLDHIFRRSLLVKIEAMKASSVNQILLVTLKNGASAFSTLPLE
jgi:hypothetical protein